ncbi:MAG: SDR family oxidoreductase [Armatimonadetes bacterium]|nr:SDR family oxidoreductase [Armatimonadota bacterium]
MSNVDKVLVLGCAGMLGHKIFCELNARGANVIGTVRWENPPEPLSKVPFLQAKNVLRGIDAGDLDLLTRILQHERPGIIVNCVGVIKQRGESHEAIPSIKINSLLPHVLAEKANAYGGKVIHFSTDCVFSGKDGLYEEDSFADADDLYGRSKFLGELHDKNSLTLRTSIIGRELSNFASLLEWFLSQEGRCNGYRKVIYSGVTTNYLAARVADLIADDLPIRGLYQVAGSPISKFELLRKLKSAYQKDIEIDPVDEPAHDKSLIGDRFEAETGYKTPSWDDMVYEMAADETPYADWR